MTDDARELARLAAKICARRAYLGRHWFFWNQRCIAFVHGRGPGIRA